MLKSLIAGNWKMNGSKKEVMALLQSLRKEAHTVKAAELAIFPPAIFLQAVEEILESSPIAWGAQNVSSHVNGAYTGEISTTMLTDFHCRYVIVGHSERRALHHETNNIVAEKFKAVIRAGIFPILCVGETYEDYQRHSSMDVVKKQLTTVLSCHNNNASMYLPIVIAYEPIWAIGTGKLPAPNYIQNMHATIRSTITELLSPSIADKTRIIYGGSVTPHNAEKLLMMQDINGLLVGKASLHAEHFLKIGRLCN